MPGVVYVLVDTVHFLEGSTPPWWVEWEVLLREVGFLVYLFSACVNPFLYLSTNNDFRQALREGNSVEPVESNVLQVMRPSFISNI